MRNTASSGEIAAEKFRKERVQTYLSIETCKTFFFRNQNLLDNFPNLLKRYS